MYYELSRWDHVIRSLIAAQTAVVHGDPMFKVNGTGTHFWLREGQLTPLLTWGGEDGESEKVLLGKTFAHPDASVNAQWFGEFSIMCKGKTVVEIVAADRSTMNISFDGKHVRGARSSVKAEYNSPTGVRLELTATENGELASVEAGDMRVRVFASGAAKFKREAQQAKYSHLNLNFEFLPTKGRGIFAELSGLRPMSEATQALLKSPRDAPRDSSPSSGEEGVISSGIRKGRSSSLLNHEATSLVGEKPRRHTREKEPYANPLNPLVGTYANQLRPLASNHNAAAPAAPAAAAAAAAATSPQWIPKPSHAAADLKEVTNLLV